LRRPPVWATITAIGKVSRFVQVAGAEDRYRSL